MTFNKQEVRGNWLVVDSTPDDDLLLDSDEVVELTETLVHIFVTTPSGSTSVVTNTVETGSSSDTATRKS